MWYYNTAIGAYGQIDIGAPSQGGPAELVRVAEQARLDPVECAASAIALVHKCGPQSGYEADGSGRKAQQFRRS